ncbi:MAG: hypothetical protein WAU75_03765, partial [Solirubrobacteraceae bacterium]
MPGFLDLPQLDLDQAIRRLRELRARGRHLVGLTLGLAVAGASLAAVDGSVGVPLLIGAAGALGLLG